MLFLLFPPSMGCLSMDTVHQGMSLITVLSFRGRCCCCSNPNSAGWAGMGQMWIGALFLGGFVGCLCTRSRSAGCCARCHLHRLCKSRVTAQPSEICPGEDEHLFLGSDFSPRKALACGIQQGSAVSTWVFCGDEHCPSQCPTTHVLL